MKRSKKINYLIRTTCLVGALFCYSAAGYAAVMANTALPSGWDVVAGKGTISTSGNTMDITNLTNTVIKWQDFNIGSVATVNFSGDKNFNVLNYVNGGNMSQIHGTLNAQGGNVYLVNPAGVFIGKSAQIDVGSLYVSNKRIDGLEGNGELDFDAAKDALTSAAPSGAELMSLGHINAMQVTFDGNRIVLDTEYVTNGIDTPIGEDNINIIAPDKNDVVLGYEAYDETVDSTTGKAIGYKEANSVSVKLANYKANSSDSYASFTKADGYMWIEDVEQLQAMNTNLTGNYALRNGIDATNTAEKPFAAIAGFEGKLDGLAGRVEGVDFGIFDLHVGDEDNLSDNVGLFASTEGATLKNLLFVSGSATGKDNVGILVGSANNTTIENITTSADVSGTDNVGGVVGSMTDGSITGLSADDPLLNTGAVTGHKNVGGIVGSLDGGTLANARNLGQISGVFVKTTANTNTENSSHNIGGLAGSASNNATLSGLQNDMTVTGSYNVGGILGSGASITLNDAVNTADITADGVGYRAEHYYYLRYTSDNPNKKIEGQWTRLANTGGIAGSITGTSALTNVTNDGGNVQSSKAVFNDEIKDYYNAGNIGGIVGYVKGDVGGVNVTITNAVNKENTVYGSHNVGGIAGYLENGSVSNALNNGGEIMATGAYGVIGTEYFADEWLGGRNTSTTYIGNMGGIVGYMYGENAYISQSGNRGSVHSMYIVDHGNIPKAAQAANVGGIVGKIARATTEDLNVRIAAIKEVPTKAAISECYNTGDVQGFTSVGGIAGQMFNGEVTGSYNLGHIQTTRRDANGTVPVNMGGIVGESSEKTDARVIVYDVYNSGVIGSENFDYYARHVGGVVGRLAGYVEKAYNTGAIYNGSNVVGGVVGYVDYGSIKDCFNTGNVTVLNHNHYASTVGGVVGGYDVRGFELSIENVYNLGTVRSFKYNSNSGDNYVGGIIGRILDHDHDLHPDDTSFKLTIKNAYTLGNIYAGIPDGNNGYKLDENAYVGAMYGGFNELNKSHVTVNQAYYITPEDETVFGNLSDANKNEYKNSNLDRTTVIEFADRMNANSYIDSSESTNNFVFSEIKNNGAVVENKEAPWRIYEDFTTPILNAFLPDAEAYFSANKDNLSSLGIDSLQYGTAYNPTLTIINANNNANIELDWGAMGVAKNASFAVYNGSLTISNFYNNGNYFGGTLYADDALTIENAIIKDADGNITNSGDILLGSGSLLYGSSIDIKSAGQLTSYGSIASTGQSGSADITLDGYEGVEIIGTVKSAATGEKVIVEGVDSTPTVDDETKAILKNQLQNVNDIYAAMPDVADYYGRIVESGANGNVAITSTGDVDVLFGVAQNGYVQSAGSITLNGASVYVDSDLSFGDKLTFNADEAVLDISNIGKVQTAQDNSKTNVEYLHDFLSQATDDKLSFVGQSTDADGKAITPDAIIAIDMSSAQDEGKLDLQQYNIVGETFSKATEKLGANQNKIHIWLENAEQLQGINNYYKNNNSSKIFSYQFALKNDIDANNLQNFHGIGYGVAGGNGGGNTDDFNMAFTGSLDGRGYSIIGLSVTPDATTHSNFDYAGLFSHIGTAGSVKDLNIISSNFTGGSVGAVAGVNDGTISNVTTFGNRVESNGNVHTTNVFSDGEHHHVSAAGGIAGINAGAISNVTTSDAVIAGDAGIQNDGAGVTRLDSTAGGIAGVNIKEISGSTTNSAITSNSGDAQALGGVVGINYGENAELNTIESWGVLNGKYKGVDGSGNTEIRSTDNVGGIAGVNYNGASIVNAYNEAHLIGGNGVGGVVGYSGSDNSAKNTITNAVNAGNITSNSDGLDVDKKAQNAGGVVGNNQNTTITNARNTGFIHGVNNVGGMVGTNGESSALNHVTNDGSATIVGTTNVGGIAGVNQGSIDAEGSDLINNGSIHGHTNVGGVAGFNEESGTIRYMNSNLTLYVDGSNAQYFGGVAGYNDGLIINATNTGSVNVAGAKYVGGITGINTEKGRITGAGNANSGKVVGDNYVGGIAGLNKGMVSGTTDDPTKVRNDGYVYAIKGGAGGIFGVNESNMQHVTLINGGIVYGQGTSGTGGLIGVNYGDINQSNLIGEVDGVVIGSANVGGLLGINYGTVAGGRDSQNNYYAHQVYNNGTVVGGEYSESDSADAVAVKDAAGNVIGYYTVDTSSSNIGGVVGNNAADTLKGTGALTAAYNTGKVLGGTSVGGVVGNNESAVDQVFNAGAVNDGTNQQVIGNKGANSSAFDYYDLNGEDYSVDNDTVWKSYDGGNKYGYNKLLKVFLTKIKFVQTADVQLIAAGQQSIVVRAVGDTVNVYTQNAAGKEVQIGYIQAADPNGAHSMADYLSSMNQDGLNGLLSGKAVDSVGTYNLFTTQQINVVDKSHNNLGYDIEPLTVKVVKYDPFEPVVPPVIDPDDPRNYDIWQAEDKYPWYQWDKQRNKRERKAEVHFVDGGMEID
ncbi:MAG: filamentous hemagglutinin N-terminal domain-containing protein [Phascolarctobacterium sp.]|uniref:filamentous hemagglutinin N-terminal domain-containing protein n=1 Tax=Phascolarctobacterium sp. TaxID=2049039 RepID=UPI0026DD5CB0|nr:filamentous hemagglutinin N-terminal domain-containing protein [Phascolarctobacterium sp.]MDO4921379.1 filamentous hemagglutinin N-terminal domain-containing protein [Phascolarctobacterium sp.]